jgi:hypothetical protein
MAKKSSEQEGYIVRRKVDAGQCDVSYYMHVTTLLPADKVLYGGTFQRSKALTGQYYSATGEIQIVVPINHDLISNVTRGMGEEPKFEIIGE